MNDLNVIQVCIWQYIVVKVYDVIAYAYLLWDYIWNKRESLSPALSIWTAFELH